MKTKILLLIVFFNTTLLFGQVLSPSQMFLKTLPEIDASVPEWAQMMYSENPSVWQVENAYEQYFLEHEYKKNIHTQNYKHWRRMVEPYINGEGLIDISSKEEKVPIKGQKKGLKSTAQSWKCIGPFETYTLGSEGNIPVSWQANVYCIAQSKSHPDILYCGTEAGGIFKTIDNGLNWFPVSHNEPISKGLEGIVVHPTNPDIVYVIDNPVGVYKTTDGGNTWFKALSLQGIGGTDILIHGSNPNIVFVACSKGLYRTTDAGNTWNQVFTDRCWDLEGKPNDPNTIYLAKKNPVEKKCELFKSTDGGVSWILKPNGWYNPTNPDRGEGGARIATTAADPDRVYVVLIGRSKPKDDGWIGVYKSEDAGESWVNPRGGDGGPYTNTRYNLATISKLGGYQQGFFNLDIEVSDIDPDKIWVGTVKLNESTDGGQTWKIVGSYGTQRLSWIHPDIQDLEVSGNEVWIASDGGVNLSTTELTSHESRKRGITASEFWGFGSGWNEDVLVGGRYHNGNTAFYEDYQDGDFLRMGGAEAATGYVNPGLNTKVYFSDIGGKIVPKNFGGKVQSFGVGKWPNESYSLGHSGEMEFDPRYYNHAYIGNQNKLWKSTDGASSYSLVKEFGTNKNDRILHIEIARSNPNVIYCAQRPGSWSAGSIWRTSDGGTSWTALTTPDPDLHYSRNMLLQVSSDDENTLWVALRYGRNGKKVYKTTDGGNTWINLTTPTLDEEQCYYLLHQAGTNGGVYLGTNNKVFYRNNTMSDWVDYSGGLPLLTPTNILRPFYKEGKIRVGTFGRGIWENSFYETSNLVVQPMVQNDKVYCTRDTVLFEDYSVLNHTGASWQWEFPGASYVNSTNVRNPKVVYGGAGTYDVSLTVTDASGQTGTKTISSMVTVDNLCNPNPVPGYALECTNNGDYVQTAPFNKTVNALTISAWIKPNGEQNHWASIVMNDGQSVGFNFTWDGNNTLGYHWPGGAWWWNSGLNVPSNQWSYVAMVATPDSIVLYLNGKEAVHKVQVNPVDITSFKIGSYKAWGGRNFKGEIDEVCIWERSLSEREIKEMRHITKEKFIDQLSAFYDSSLIAYYQFNETEGIVMDKVGTNHGTLSGNSTIITSNAPVGGGLSQFMTINEKRNLNFKKVGVKVKYENSPSIGDVVVTRLNLLPDSIPSEDPNLGCYWIINNYGDSSLANINKLKFRPLLVSDDTEYDDLDELSVVLFEREDNEYLNNWLEICSLSGEEDDDDSEDEDEEEYFVFGKKCNITDMGQFFISLANDVKLLKSVTQKEEVSELKLNVVNNIALYPNPVNKGSVLYINYGGEERARLRIFDVNGKQVLDRFLKSNNNEVAISSLPNGLYFYSIMGETFIKNGKIVIQE